MLVARQSPPKPPPLYGNGGGCKTGQDGQRVTVAVAIAVTVAVAISVAVALHNLPHTGQHHVIARQDGIVGQVDCGCTWRDHSCRRGFVAVVDVVDVVALLSLLLLPLLLLPLLLSLLLCCCRY
jgi:hypothetical protein